MTHAAIQPLNFSDKDVLRRTSRQNITIALHTAGVEPLGPVWLL